MNSKISNYTCLLIVLFSMCLFSLTANAATLTLTPSSQSILVDQTFTVDINLNTQGTPIDGVDIYSLRYNNVILEVQDANTGVIGIQITPGTLLSNTLTNTVNTANGTIQFSQVTTGGTTYNSSGKLATITFKAKTNGTSAVTFDFTLGSTSDTNVAGTGQDKLTSVGNGSYSVFGGVGTTPTPTPISYSYQTPATYQYQTPYVYQTPSTPAKTPTPTPTPAFISAPSSVPPNPASCPCSLWNNSQTPAIITDPGKDALEIGVKFKSDVSGYIAGLRFYKSPSNTGIHIGNLWTLDGRLLGSLTFTNETASGWQQTNFPNSIPISANTIYIASYHTDTGSFSVDRDYFNSAFHNPPLHAISNSESLNGVFYYGSSAFPDGSYSSSNYWVDVTFTTSASQASTSIPAQSLAIGPNLALSPAVQSVSIGQTFTADILLDTKGMAIDGVDIYSLRYNPAILEVQDANTSVNGVQISAGTLLANTLTNTVNAANGTIQFSQVTTGGSTYTGSGKLATITFKGKAVGTSLITFNFTPGKTSDTNVAGSGQDKLTSVTNGSYAVLAISAPTPTPNLSPTPIPLVSDQIKPVISSFDIQPKNNSDRATISWGVSDTGGSYLERVEIQRARFDPIDCNDGFRGLCEWETVKAVNAPGNRTSWLGSIIDTPAISGTYWYGIHILDRAGNRRVESTPIRIAINSSLIQPSSLQKNITIGSRGNDVAELQNFLIKKGYFTSSVGATGYFGPITKTALANWQRDNNIPATGYFGPISRGKYQKEISASDSNLAPTPIVCTQEAKLCPDGSYVGRTGLNCEFAACPVTSPTPISTQTTLQQLQQQIQQTIQQLNQLIQQLQSL